MPYAAFQVYIRRRNNKFVYQRNPSELLFLAEDGTPLTRSLFMFHVKQMIFRLGLNNNASRDINLGLVLAPQRALRGWKII